MKKYNKLVRDNIPEIIRASGEEPETKTLNDKEYLKELIKKLKEETAEFEDEPSIEELADIKEVLIALRETMNIDASELEDTRRKKAIKNGSFKKKTFLKSVKPKQTLPKTS